MIADPCADRAKVLYREYIEASKLADGDAARTRMLAIVEAAKDENVFRIFVLLRDGLLGATA